MVVCKLPCKRGATIKLLRGCWSLAQARPRLLEVPCVCWCAQKDEGRAAGERWS